MRTPKKAKCGIHSLSFCNTKHDAPQCTNCVLVQHRERLYKFVNGHKLKRCPQCGEYKMLHEFKVNSAGHRSWCYECHKTKARERHRLDKKQFMVGHRVGERKVHVSVKSVVELIKFIRKCINNDERLIEIKRI